MSDGPRFPVLMVEDDPDDQVLIRRAFVRAGAGIPVHVAGHGDEAIAYLSGAGAFADRARHPLPGLVLLDLKLPRRSGFEVLEWLRAQPRLRRIPVVVLTSSRETPDLARAYELGANSYLVKPPDLAALTAMMQTVDAYWVRLSQPPPV